MPNGHLSSTTVMQTNRCRTTGRQRRRFMDQARAGRRIRTRDLSVMDNHMNDDDEDNYDGEDRFWRGFAKFYFIMTAIFLLIVGIITLFSDPLSSIPILAGALVIGFLSRGIK